MVYRPCHRSYAIPVLMEILDQWQLKHQIVNLWDLLSLFIY